MARISDLPLCIIEIILCCLPYQDVVKTSILSKEWRYRWTKIPKIAVVIVDTCQATPLKRKREEKQMMIKKSKPLSDICKTLSKHEGPIQEFNLSLIKEKYCQENDNVHEIDSIISQLSRKNTVKKMILDNSGWSSKSIPISSLLSMSQLTYLYVKGWTLRSEPASSWPKHGTSGLSRKKKTTSGLGSLTSFYARLACFSMETLQHLLSKCPLLKTLAVRDHFPVEPTNYASAEAITTLFKSLPMIENLTFCCRFLRYIPLGNSRKEVVPIALVHLRHLCIENFYFGDYYVLRIISRFIKSSPNLEKLTVKIKDYERHRKTMDFSYTMEEYTDIWMEHLSELEITYISGEETEMDFVKLILMRSPVLKKLRIFISENYKDKEMEISETLLSAPRASPVVELIVEKEPF